MQMRASSFFVTAFAPFHVLSLDSTTAILYNQEEEISASAGRPAPRRTAPFSTIKIRKENSYGTVGTAAAAAHAGGSLRPAASARQRSGVPPHHRKRPHPQYDLLRPLRRRQDHGGQHHRRGQRHAAPQTQWHHGLHQRHQIGAGGH